MIYLYSSTYIHINNNYTDLEGAGSKNFNDTGAKSKMFDPHIGFSQGLFGFNFIVQ